jgi:hypothetical protein
MLPISQQVASLQQDVSLLLMNLQDRYTDDDPEIFHMGIQLLSALTNQKIFESREAKGITGQIINTIVQLVGNTIFDRQSGKIICPEIDREKFSRFIPFFEIVNRLFPYHEFNDSQDVPFLKCLFANLPLEGARNSFANLRFPESEIASYVRAQYELFAGNACDRLLHVFGKQIPDELHYATLAKLLSRTSPLEAGKKKALQEKVHQYVCDQFDENPFTYITEKESIVQVLQEYLPKATPCTRDVVQIDELYDMLKARKVVVQTMRPQWYHGIGSQELQEIITTGKISGSIELINFPVDKNQNEFYVGFTNKVITCDREPECKKLTIEEGLRARIIKGTQALFDAVCVIGIPDSIYKKEKRAWQQRLHVQFPHIAVISVTQVRAVANIILGAIGTPNLSPNWWGNSAAVSSQYGRGLPNRFDNSCYVNASIQALRFVECFRNKMNECPKNSFLYPVKQAIDFIEGREVRLSFDSRAFRKTAIGNGWRADSESSQEDAAAFCQFLLPHLGFKPFDYETKIDHTFFLPLNSLKTQKANDMLHIAVGFNSKQEELSIHKLLTSNEIVEVLDKQSAKNADGVILTESELQKLDEKEDFSPILTKQKIVLTSKHAPDLLTVEIKRFTKEGKQETPIEPSYLISLVQEGEEAKEIWYELRAIVVHQGTTAMSGHYYTYAVNMTKDGSLSWVQFNDRSVISDAPKALEDIQKRSHLCFYERV